MVKKAICPNCGAEGTVGRYCEFCGTKIPAPIVKQTASCKQENNLIVEDKLTEETLTTALPNTLVNQEDVPTNVFDDIEIKDITKYIIPMYAYKGTFQAPWSCVKLVEEIYKVGDETKRRTKRYPMNGIASGSYAYLFPSCDMENIPSKLKSFILTEMLDKGDIIDCSVSRSLTDSEQNCIVNDNDDTEGLVWRNFDGNNLIEKIVNKSIDYQLPSDYEDFSCSYTTNRTKGTKVLVPIWVLNYTHKEKTYTFIVDGILQNKVIEHPIDQDYTDNIKDLSETSDSTSLYGILLAIVDAIIGIISFGLLISVLTRSQIDSNGEVAFRLFLADILFFVFAFCLSKAKELLHKSKVANSTIEIAKISHKVNVINNYHDKIIEQNCLGLSAEQLAIVTDLHIDNFKETSKKLHSIQQPKDINTGKWIPFVIIAFVIYVFINIGFIGGCVQKDNVEKEKRELAIRDSIEQEKAMQQQKEERKKRNYRPSAPTPSCSDVEVIGLPNGVKQIRMTSEKENTIYEFNKHGFLISVKCNRNYTTFTSSHSYTIKQGKLISQDGKEVEYNKVSANEDIISCDNYTLCNVTYDSKNRIVKIKDEYDTSTFAYDEENNAHEEREDIWGNAKTEEKMSIPILDIIGSSIYIPKNWEDKITSSDEQGRPTEIVYDGILHKETVKITYW